MRRARRFKVADSLEAAQSRVALQALGNRRTTLGAHVVAAKADTTEGTAVKRHTGVIGC